MNEEWLVKTIEAVKQNVADVTPREAHVFDRFAKRNHVARDTNAEFERSLTFGQRLADRISSFGGSWLFILIFFAVLVAWVALNSVVLARAGKPFDPYPYILLNLFLSMLASLQAPVILMSQNRQSAKDRVDAAHDYEVNLKSELEIMALHEKMDGLRQKQWDDLIQLQREQIRLLEETLHQLKKDASRA